MTNVEIVALDEIDLFRAIRRSPSRSNIGIARHLLPILTDIIARERAAALAAATPLIEARVREECIAAVRSVPHGPGCGVANCEAAIRKGRP